VRSAEERLRFYAEQFNTVEVEVMAELGHSPWQIRPPRLSVEERLERIKHVGNLQLVPEVSL
jgi:hypothetical protein